MGTRMNSEQRLLGLETTVDRYIRHSVAADTEAGIQRAVDEFNGWVAAADQEFEARREELDRARRGIDCLQEDLRKRDDLLAGEIDASDGAAVDAHNQRVRDRNALAEDLGRTIDAHNAEVQRLNAEREQHGRQYDERRRETDEAVRRMEAEWEAYASWCDGDGAERLWKELNAAFADLLPESCGRETSGLARARALRREVAEHAIREELRLSRGLLMLEARLAAESAWLIVDTGSTGTALSPEAVRAMGWSGQTGDMVELSLAGGLRLSARTLLVPAMSVDGHAADNVKAVVVESPGPGLDGILGLSFLNRFDYTISGGERPRLTLRAKGEATAQAEYDVFLCHKSEDQETARALFDYLRAEGYRPFFSPVSLGAKASASFQQAVDRALELARHMVVVGSSRANMEAPWVRGEWQRFEVLRNTGRKTGSLVVLLAGTMRNIDLPVGLVHCEAVSVSSPGWREELRRFLP